MSNEYKDWLQDKALDVLLENGSLSRIEYSIYFKQGYIIIGRDSDYNHHIYYVWKDEDWGWGYREVNI